MKKWSVSQLNKEKAAAICEQYNLPMLIAMLLSVRGITSKDDIEDFLFNESTLFDPFEIKDMDKAVLRIRQALDNFESICIYGDYDADGVTSTALLYSYLETAGANVSYYIPSREDEGYGLNMNAILELANRGVTLIITVDNGIAAVEEITYAKSLGVDTVVTDHHMPGDVLPSACAVVDLHRKDCNSHFKELSGVGVVFKLVMALEGEFCDTQTLLDNYSDIACLGTIGDIVSLTGENRVIVKNGLKNLSNTDKCGIMAILEESGLSGKKMKAGSVSFTVVPRINACGRLGLSEKSVSLLLTDDEQYAYEISQQLGQDNSKRQQIEKDILQIIEKRISENPRLIKDKIIVIDGDNWHQGVIGIVSARIKEAFNKPCIIISKEGENAKASGRSIEGFALCDALFYCKDLLIHYGGHPMAVGFSLESKNIDKLRLMINQYAQTVSMPVPKLSIDCKLNPAALNVSLAEQLTYLEPYGAGNPTPVFGLYNMVLSDIKPLGNNKHLLLTLKRGEYTVTALKFSTSTDKFGYFIGDEIDLAVTLDVNVYNQNKSLSIIIKDIKFSDCDNEKLILSREVYDRFSTDLPVSYEEAQKIIPSRDDFAFVYRYLKNQKEFNFTTDILSYRLNNKLEYAKLLIVLDVLSECKLISYIQRLGRTEIKVLPTQGKQNLFDTQIMKKLRGLC